MKDYLSLDVRNVVLLGHSGAGKSTVGEACLHFTKAIDRMGKASDGTTALNFDADEGKRGLSCYILIMPQLRRISRRSFIKQ